RQVLVERVAFDQSQPAVRQLVIEPLAEEGGEAPVELDRRHPGSGVEETAGQEAETRADLEDARSRTGRGLGEDRLEDVGVGQEVLAQAVAGAEARVAHRPANARRVDPGPAGAHRDDPRRLSGGPAAATAARPATDRPARR